MHVCALPVSLGPIPPGPPRSQALLPGGEEQSLRRLAATRIIKHRHWLHFWRRRFIIYRNTGTHADWLRGRKGRLNGRQPRNPKSANRLVTTKQGRRRRPPPPSPCLVLSEVVLYFVLVGEGEGGGQGGERNLARKKGKAERRRLGRRGRGKGGRRRREKETGEEARETKRKRRQGGGTLITKTAAGEPPIGQSPGRVLRASSAIIFCDWSAVELRCFI